MLLQLASFAAVGPQSLPGVPLQTPNLVQATLMRGRSILAHEYVFDLFNRRFPILSCAQNCWRLDTIEKRDFVFCRECPPNLASALPMHSFMPSVQPPVRTKYLKF